MRVCFVSHTAAMGGAERALLELMDGLQAKGVTCFALVPNQGPLTRQIERRGVPYAVIHYRSWAVPSKWWKWPLSNSWTLRTVIPAARQFQRWHIDVVYTNTAVIWAGALAAKLAGLPHIWHLHEFVKEEHRLKFHLGMKLSSKLIARLSTIVVVCSKALGDYYADFIPRHQLRTVYQAVQSCCPTEESNQPTLIQKKGAPKLLLVGTFQEGKRQIEAIKALAVLSAQGSAAELFLVGSSSPAYLDELRRAASQDGLQEVVHFLGYVENAAPLMKQADIVLSCSVWEAFPRVVVEAMKAGKPVIAARHGATPELVEYGFNGLLYQPGDHVGLAEKIKYLLENPETAKAMGANGKRRAEEQYTIEKYAAGVLQVLEEALRSGSATS